MRYRSLLLIACLAAGPATAPVGSIDNPRRITTADVGPAIDPTKLAASPYAGLTRFRTFGGFVSQCYAVPGVWACAGGDDPALYAANVGYDYPDFYRPMWAEVFDHVARQMHCRWAFDPRNRQFTFTPADRLPPFTVKLDEGWRREDRGQYVWFAPADAPFGMDVYDYGHYTKADVRKVRQYLALRDVSGWPTPPTVGQMTTVKVAGADALYLRCDTPRPGGVWRQWAVVTPDGHAYLIVSAMPKDREPTVGPAVDRMVATFATRP